MTAHAASSEATRTAFEFEGERVSWAGLTSVCETLALALNGFSERGEAIALLLPNGTAMVSLLLACRRSDRVPMPLSPDMPAQELLELLRSARCRHLVTDRAGCARLELDNSEGYRPWTVHCSDGASLELVWQSPEPTPPQPCAADAGLILQSSGSSTGRPRSIQVSQRALAAVIQGRINEAAIDAGSRAVVGSSLCHSVGLYQVLAYLQCGASFHLLRDYATGPLADAVEHQRPTHLIMPVNAFDELLHVPGLPATALAQLRFACVGADCVTERAQGRFRDMTGHFLSVSYGMSESSWILLNRDPSGGEELALGRPTAGASVELRSPDGAVLPAGETGELFVRSERSFSGYLRDGQLTVTTAGDGWLATGDLAFRDESGLYWFAGRRGEQIVLNTGDVILPQEIERAALQVPGISKAIAVGLQDPAAPEGQRAEVPWLFVVASDAQSATADQLIEKLRVKLSSHKLPLVVRILPSLPVGSTGKTSRRLLRERYGEQHPGPQT